MPGYLLRVVVFGIAMLLMACGAGPATIKYPTGSQTVAAGQQQEWTFDKDGAGPLAAPAETFSGTWTVRAEADAPTPPQALCQTATATFPAMALSGTVYADVEVSTRFKTLTGRTDQAAGIIFRAQDKDNFYILRANSLENNVNFYKYSGGRRGNLKGANITVPNSQWLELKVEMVGNRMRAFLNGQPVVEETDDTFKAGRVGLWTKADSVTCFDNVRATAK